MRAPQLSPRAFQRLTLLNIVLLVAIIVSGAVVRLTNSGLGCADWPNCSATKIVDVSGHHAAIEQVNRIFSGAIGIPIALALLGAYWRVPRRSDLVKLAWVLFGLFWAEAALGGIAVEVKLAWVSVTGHFLLAIALVSVALIMHRRAGEPDGVREPLVPPGPLALARAVYVLTLWVLVMGTLVTAAGPHGGDNEARRLGYPLADVARVHAVSVDVLVAAHPGAGDRPGSCRRAATRALGCVGDDRRDGGARGARLRAVLRAHSRNPRRLPRIRRGMRICVRAAAAPGAPHRRTRRSCPC